jgi:glycosyltransferase involved in cell wall biosynthesis
MTSVSVVVATCDRPDELATCLRSLLAQSRAASRIVVVDDAPEGEETRSVVARAAREGAVRYVEGAGQGLAAAHNRGLEHVDTPLVAFTDDDVVADRRWLEQVVAAFTETPGEGCVTGRIVPYELATRAQELLDGYAGYDKGAERRVYDLGDGRPDDPLFPFAAGKLGSGANMSFTRAALGRAPGAATTLRRSSRSCSAATGSSTSPAPWWPTATPATSPCSAGRPTATASG